MTHVLKLFVIREGIPYLFHHQDDCTFFTGVPRFVCSLNAYHDSELCMTKFTLAILACVTLVISGCMAAPPLAPEWKLEKEGIVLNLKAAPLLNESEGRGHALYLVIYQLSSPNGFNQHCQNREGLAGLLESRVFDPSVTAVKSLVIYPDSDTTHRIDRAEGTMFLGIVAGYNTMTETNITRLFEIPVILEGKRLFIKPGKQAPGKLVIDLRLGPHQIETLPDDDEKKGF